MINKIHHHRYLYHQHFYHYHHHHYQHRHHHHHALKCSSNNELGNNKTNNIYEGSWKDDKKAGFGKMTYWDDTVSE